MEFYGNAGWDRSFYKGHRSRNHKSSIDQIRLELETMIADVIGLTS